MGLIRDFFPVCMKFFIPPFPSVKKTPKWLYMYFMFLPVNNSENAKLTNLFQHNFVSIFLGLQHKDSYGTCLNSHNNNILERRKVWLGKNHFFTWSIYETTFKSKIWNFSYCSVCHMTNFRLWVKYTFVFWKVCWRWASFQYFLEQDFICLFLKISKVWVNPRLGTSCSFKIFAVFCDWVIFDTDLKSHGPVSCWIQNYLSEKLVIWLIFSYKLLSTANSRYVSWVFETQTQYSFLKGRKWWIELSVNQNRW